MSHYSHLDAHVHYTGVNLHVHQSIHVCAVASSEELQLYSKSYCWGARHLPATGTRCVYVHVHVYTCTVVLLTECLTCCAEDVSDEEDVQLPSTTAVPDDDHFEAAFEVVLLHVIHVHVVLGAQVHGSHPLR